MDPELLNVLIKAGIILGVFGVSLLIATYCTLAERRIAGFIQDRQGPNRAGPGGIFQPLADAVKLFTKEEFIPSGASKALFIIAPGIAMFTASMTSAVVPFGNTLIIDGKEIMLQAIEVNIGVLYIFGLVALGVYGIMIGGWASNNKFSLLGAIRAASQNISYELAMGLSLIAVLMMAGSLSLRDIVLQQTGAQGMGNWNFWNVVYHPVAFMVFLICAFAETNRTPFDLPESEAELVGGYHTEYSGMGLGLYLFAEYVNIFVVSAVMATLFFGGFNFPFMHDLGLSHNAITIIGVFVLFGKIFLFIFLFMWVRWTLPRFRYDQLMNLGWRYLIPISLVNILITGAVILLHDKI